MQTFLPYYGFYRCAQVLDYRRLGKQRLEAYQIYHFIRTGAGGSYQRHPALLMWRGYEAALAQYYNAMRDEWIERGYNNTMPALNIGPGPMPPWLFDDRLTDSHRSNLLRKDPLWYGQFNWTVPNDLPYWWPNSSST